MRIPYKVNLALLKSARNLVYLVGKSQSPKESASSLLYASSMVDTRVIGVALAILLVVLYAGGSGFFIDNSGPNAGWYQSLNKPSWQPPDVVFGLIWPYNFIILGTSGFFVVRDASATKSILFLVLLALSVVAALTWAYFFYQPHNFTAASISLGLAALFTLPLVILTLQTNLTLGVFLLPYQAWLVTATLLSASYGRLN